MIAMNIGKKTCITYYTGRPEIWSDKKQLEEGESSLGILFVKVTFDAHKSNYYVTCFRRYGFGFLFRPQC